MPRNNDIKKVLVIGSGPIVIGQAAEFDYAGTQACRSLKEEGLLWYLLREQPLLKKLYCCHLTRWALLLYLLHRLYPDGRVQHSRHTLQEDLKPCTNRQPLTHIYCLQEVPTVCNKPFEPLYRKTVQKTLPQGLRELCP